MTPRASVLRSLPALFLALAFTACDKNPSEVVDTPEILFFAQSQPPTADLDAAFDGDVGPGPQGCLRQGRDGATVLWPVGYRVEERGGQLFVVDAGGSETGRIGFDFSLSGGLVSTLDETSGLSESDRALAAASCPGTYWIVGEVL